MLSAVPTETAREQSRRTRQEVRARIVAAANELIRRRSYAELSVDEVMRDAGLGRTIFYRHFDDLGDLLIRVSQEAIGELYEAQPPLEDMTPGDEIAAVRRASSRPSQSITATARCCARSPRPRRATRSWPASRGDAGRFAELNRRYLREAQ